MSWASGKNSDLSLDSLATSKLTVSGNSTVNALNATSLGCSGAANIIGALSVGGNSTVAEITAESLKVSGAIDIDGISTLTTLYANGPVFALGGCMQINDCNGTNPYLDFACIDGNADNDVRIQCAAGVNTSIAGQGSMAIYAATGVSMNGPLTVPLVNVSGNLTAANALSNTLTVSGTSDLTDVSADTILVADLSAESIVNSGLTTLNDQLLVNGSVFCNGGNLQINTFDGSNAYLDMTADEGNGDYDARIMVSTINGSTTSGCGKLTVYALDGINMDGPISTTNVVTPLINGNSPLIAVGYGSIASQVFLNSTCSPTTASSTFLVYNNTFSNGIFLPSSSAYSCSSFVVSAVSATFNSIAGIQYTWAVNLFGGGDDPQANSGTISYVIY